MDTTRSAAGRELARIARRQLSLFTLHQALESGMTQSFAYRKRRARSWIEIEPRVFRHATSGPMSWQQRTMARILTTGGIACGRSAAARYGLMDPPREVEVVVQRSHRSVRHRRSGVRSIETLDPCDSTRVGGIPATTPAMTLIMLGIQVPEALLGDLVDTAIVNRLTTPRRLAERATALWAPPAGDAPPSSASSARPIRSFGERAANGRPE